MLLRRFERFAARFNKWLAPAALASNAESGGPGAASVDAARVTAILGELEHHEPDREDADQGRSED